MKESVELFHKSVEKGNSTSMFHLGCIYHYGVDPIAVDLKLAVTYYEMAAELGTF